MLKKHQRQKNIRPIINQVSFYVTRGMTVSKVEKKNGEIPQDCVVGQKKLHTAPS